MNLSLICLWQRLFNLVFLGFSPGQTIDPVAINPHSPSFLLHTLFRLLSDHYPIPYINLPSILPTRPILADRSIY
ncbi:hypothetical protein PGTUg99_001748 [Puccinia graminis f. sp. tritici]|uniref:Uncharacterized protein n=1 Tax=Puccinia graminis f. sp. tritici TaxID=56615 RepID=A0A5B0SHI3_PUCGR|nr:hypothetical protein PGTUg99_001748 [Puccinia graminis f. sp. tritici]